MWPFNLTLPFVNWRASISSLNDEIIPLTARQQQSKPQAAKEKKMTLQDCLCYLCSTAFSRNAVLQKRESVPRANTERTIAENSLIEVFSSSLITREDYPNKQYPNHYLCRQQWSGKTSAFKKKVKLHIS